MVVDDSADLLHLIGIILKMEGHESIPLTSPVELMQKIDEYNPDLIMLDIEMPRMDGYQLLASLRALPAYRNLPVVMISSRSSEKHRQKAFDLGATDYLVKPYQEDQVISLIKHLVKEVTQ